MLASLVSPNDATPAGIGFVLQAWSLIADTPSHHSRSAYADPTVRALASTLLCCHIAFWI